MKHKIKNRNGYISIEAVIVAAIVITAGLTATNSFSAIATSKSSQRAENLNAYILQSIETEPVVQEPEVFPTIPPTPTEPTVPVTPTEPPLPQEPTPTEPTQPTDPLPPSEPEIPVSPVEPENPTTPITDTYIVTVNDGFTVNQIGWLEGSFSAQESDILIPREVGGTIVYAIQQDAFNGKSLESVVFAQNSVVTRIHARAFASNNISTLSLPETLTRIDLLAFRDNAITELVLPEPLTIIEQNAFRGNPIMKITIGSQVESIRNNSLGIHHNGFTAAYSSGGAGTYRYLNGQWIKQ